MYNETFFFFFTDVLNLKKKEQSKSVLESYNSLVKRLVCGDVCHFVGDVRSDRLTETLFALRALEKDNKLAVTGNVARGDKEYEDILERLQFLCVLHCIFEVVYIFYFIVVGLLFD
jgi:hypothetical protein